MADRQAPDVRDLLRSLDLGDMADREEDRRLGQAVHRHVQQTGEIGERPAHAEGEGDDAHMLDRGIGEQPFDVAPPVQHEGGEAAATSAPWSLSGPGAIVARWPHQHLEAQDRIERHVEQQTGQHRRNRRRPLRMGIGQPRVQRRQTDFGAVADQQEDEGEVQQRRIERAACVHQHGPRHGRRVLRP